MEPRNGEGSQPMEKISPLAAIQTLLDEQEEKIHNLRAEKHELKVSETALKQLLGKRDNTILHLTAEREELQNSVENWKHQKSEALEREKVLKLQAKEYEVRLNKLKQESPDHEALVSRLQLQTEVLKGSEAKLSMELTATKERLFRLQKDNLALENRSREAAEEHKAEKESFLRSLDELQKQKSEVEAEANEWLQENIKLETDNRKAKWAKQKAEKESEYRQALLQRTEAIFNAFAAASNKVSQKSHTLEMSLKEKRGVPLIPDFQTNLLVETPPRADLRSGKKRPRSKD
jgi:chromosome segregation ATPase